MNNPTKKLPQKLSLSYMFDKVTGMKLPTNNVFFKHGMAVVINAEGVLQPFISAAKGPYIIEDYRIGFVQRGTMHSIVNLQEYTVTAATAIFITPGTILEPLDISDDFMLCGIGMNADIFHLIHSGRVPEIFNGANKHGILPLSQQDGQLLKLLYDNLLGIVSSQDVGDRVVHHAVACISCLYNDIFTRRHGSTPVSNSGKVLFDRFIRLVTNNCRRERRLGFYADKLCVTGRYLGTVVRQTSGVTAKEWIDRAVITAAKVLLRHSNHQISQIAEELNFPNPSFFCKYFKQHVGCTPQAFRTHQ